MGALDSQREAGGGDNRKQDGDGASIGLVAELIVAERECCPFLTFELVALPNKGPLIVRVTGPDGTKEFVRSVFMQL